MAFNYKYNGVDLSEMVQSGSSALNGFSGFDYTSTSDVVAKHDSNSVVMRNFDNIGPAQNDIKGIVITNSGPIAKPSWANHYKVRIASTQGNAGSWGTPGTSRQSVDKDCATGKKECTTGWGGRGGSGGNAGLGAVVYTTTPITATRGNNEYKFVIDGGNVRFSEWDGTAWSDILSANKGNNGNNGNNGTPGGVNINCVNRQCNPYAGDNGTNGNNGTPGSVGSNLGGSSTTGTTTSATESTEIYWFQCI
jgi:hypothetical protein